jgi:hypothetical protein
MHKWVYSLKSKEGARCFYRHYAGATPVHMVYMRQKNTSQCFGKCSIEAKGIYIIYEVSDCEAPFYLE